MRAHALGAGLAIALAACSERRPDIGGPDPPDTGLYTLSGTVLETTPQGPVPVRTDVAYEYHRPGESFTTGGYVTAETGRYTFEHVLSGTTIKLRAIVRTGVWTHQPCAVRTVVRSDTVLDIEVLRPGVVGVTTGSPTVRGQVFQMTPAGRQPIPNADVDFIQGCSGLQTPYMRTDADGRYAFCRVPAGSGCIRAALERYGDHPWFNGRQVSVSVNGDIVQDVELVPGEPPGLLFQKPSRGLAVK